MSLNYELSIGGTKSSSDNLLITDLHDLEVNDTHTSFSSWNAEIPQDNSIDDRIQEDVYVYLNNDIVFRGRLEKISESSSGTMSLSGRGVGIELAKTTPTGAQVSYTSTNVYQALRDMWDRTSFNAIVQPKNKDLLDEQIEFDDEIANFLDNQTGIFSPPDTEPIVSDEDIAKVMKLHDTVDHDVMTHNGALVSNSSYSLTEGIRLSGDNGGTYAYHQHTRNSNQNLLYDLTNYAWHVRLDASSITDATVDFVIETEGGTRYTVGQWSISSSDPSHQWIDAINDSSITHPESPPSELSKFGTYQFRVEVSGLASGEYIDIDAMSVTNEDYASYTLPTSTNAENVYSGPKWWSQVFSWDTKPSISAYDEKLITSASTTSVECNARYTEPITDAHMELYADNNATTATDDRTLASPKQNVHYEFTFASSDTEFNPILYFNNSTPSTQTSSGESDIQWIDDFYYYVPDGTKLTQIDDQTFEGTNWEILQDLHDLGNYRFAISDWENKSVDSFPIGSRNYEPDWTITKSNRKINYSSYANRVTVFGKEQSDGTINKATVEDTTEQNLVGEVVEAFEKNTDVTTQAEVDDYAQRLLEKKIEEKKESGSISIVPQGGFIPGPEYPVYSWSRIFDSGGRIGMDAAYLQSGGDYIDVGAFGSQYTDWTLEMLIRPEQILELGDNEFQVIGGIKNATGYTEVRVYGDGSIGWQPFSTVRRSSPDLIEDFTTHRVSIVSDSDNSYEGLSTGAVILLDGEILSGTATVDATTVSNEGFRVGIDYNNLDSTESFIGGVEDIRFWDMSVSQSNVNEVLYKDLVRESTSFGEPYHYYRVDDNSSNTILDEGSASAQNASMDGTLNGSTATYDARFGALDEVTYSLGSDGTVDLRFDISGRLEAELVRIMRQSEKATKNQ